jgi:hypothetical protein
MVPNLLLIYREKQKPPLGLAAESLVRMLEEHGLEWLYQSL